MKKLLPILFVTLLSVACGAPTGNGQTERTASEDAPAAAPTEAPAEEASEESASEESALEESAAEEVSPTEEPEEEAEVATAENVEIALLDELDGILNGYCVDIAGGNENVDPANGLQAHTCYSYQGALGTDQIFDTGRFAENVLYMPDYDVCAQAASLEAGAEVGLASCDGGELQSFVFDGTISPAAAPELCFTAAEESRMGRGSQHQIRDLTLELCSDDLAAYQQWGTNAETATE